MDESYFWPLHLSSFHYEIILVYPVIVLNIWKNSFYSSVGAISPTAGSSAYSHRRSLAGLTGRLPLSAFTNSVRNGGWSCSLNRRRNLSKPEPKTQQPPTSAPASNNQHPQRPFFFSSWRRSYSTSKGSKRFATSSSSKKRMNDVKSMENLLSSGVDEDGYKTRKVSRQIETTLPFDCWIHF